MGSVSEALSLFANIAMACAALAGAFAAFKGLRTWKDQSKWERDHQLARGLLLAFYKHRDSIRNLRNPFMFGSELEVETTDEAEVQTEGERRFLGTKQAYLRRWKTVQEANQELYALLLEADVIWGKELSERSKGIRGLENELYSGIRIYLLSIDPNEDEESRAEYRKMRKENRDRKLLYERLSGDDPFMADYLTELGLIEEALKPYLGRSG